MKETFFFNDYNNYKKGMDWYKCHFPKKLKVDKESSKITFDASANYFESKDSAQRIKEQFPKAKIIILLRNPVDRAYSHYQMAKSRKFESSTFEEALRLEDERIESGESVKNQYGHNYVYQKLGYRAKGIYIDLVKKWMEEFPENQLMFINSEELFSKSDLIYQQVLSFTGLENAKLASAEAQNKQTYGPMLEETRTLLNAFYAPFNEELYEVLGRSFNWS